jgi:hypothetical protein
MHAAGPAGDHDQTHIVGVPATGSNRALDLRRRRPRSPGTARATGSRVRIMWDGDGRSHEPGGPPLLRHVREEHLDARVDEHGSSVASWPVARARSQMWTSLSMKMPTVASAIAHPKPSGEVHVPSSCTRLGEPGRDGGAGPSVVRGGGFLPRGRGFSLQCREPSRHRSGHVIDQFAPTIPHKALGARAGHLEEALNLLSSAMPRHGNV